MKPAAWLIAVAALAQDPSDTLVKARDKILSEVRSLPRSVCVETIDRSYFSRENPPDPPPSCEQINIDRKKARYKLNLNATDRLRVSVAFAQDREVYSWIGNAPSSHDVNDALQPGPIGTGAYAAHLLDIFGNPAVRFRLLEENPETLEYGFRVPIEASRFVIGAGQEWLATGYSGSLNIDRDSLEIRRFTVETEELPLKTSMCEISTALEFQSHRTAGDNWFVPTQSRSHHVMRDTSETDRVTAFSDCREPPAIRPASIQGEPLPPGLNVSLAFDAPIDTDVAAAGDMISATVTEPVLKGFKLLVPVGAKVTGRIVRMEHQREPALFMISVAFDTLEMNGAASLFYAKLSGPPVIEKPGHQIMKLTTNGQKEWPHGMFIFSSRKPRYVVPAQYKSKWVTTVR